MNTENITSPAPGWFRIEVTPTSVLLDSGHYVVGESILLPVGPNHITPADLISMAISAAGRAAIPGLIKSLEAVMGEPVKRKRSPKEEAGQPSEEQVPAPAPVSELPLAETPTTEGGAE